MPGVAIPSLGKDGAGLAGLFATSGVLHMVRPQVFEWTIPSALPAPRALVYASGVAELACAAGILYPRTRTIAGLAGAGLLVAIFPANIQMSVDLGRKAARTRTASSRAIFAGTVARLPLQWPMIRTALRLGGR